MKYLIVFFFASVSIISCETPGAEVGPTPFAAYIYTKEGVNYLDQHQDDSVMVYHLKGGQKIYSTVRVWTNTDSTILEVVNDFQHDSNLQDYYLQVGDDIDTLLIKRKGFEFQEVRFNNKPVEWRYKPEIHFFITKE